MLFENVQELKNHLLEIGCEDSIVFDPDFARAAVGVSETGRVIYDYDLMVESLAQSDGFNEESAIEWIEYNTIRSLPYMGEMAPIVMRKFYD